MRGLVAALILCVCFTAMAQPATRAEALLARDCKSCHVLEAKADAAELQLLDGPPLIHAGAKFRYEWLIHWLQQPTRIRPAGYLPFRYTLVAPEGDQVDVSLLPQHPALSHEDALAIAEWFKSKRRVVPASPGAAADVARGTLHFQKILGCAGCHQAAHKGGPSGPELGTAAARLDADWLREFVADTQAWSPTVMPQIAVQPAQLDAVVRFVEQLDEPAGSAIAIPPATAHARAHAEGALTRPALLYQIYCSQCHGVRGNGKGINAPHLFVAPRDHTSAMEMEHLTREDVFTAIKFGGRAVGKSSLMPSWAGTIADEDIRLLAGYVGGLSRAPHDAAP